MYTIFGSLKPLFIPGLILSIFLLLTYCDDQITDPGDDEPSDPGAGNGETNGEISFHRDGPGDSARDFLTDNDFSDLYIEVQYMEGYEPDADLEEKLEDFLSEYIHKDQITIDVTSISSQGRESYTSEEVRDLEEEYRTAYNDEDDDVLNAYLLLLDGEFENRDVLGIAYWNTSIALFQKRIEDISGGLRGPSQDVVERTVAKHELGHILGLVDNGTPMQNDHKDEGRGAHCDDDECLMYYAMTRDFLSDFLIGGSVPDFDEFCQEDLEANGGR